MRALNRTIQQDAGRDAADTKETLVALGVDLANATPAQLAALLVEDLARRSKIVKESGATID